MPHSTLSSSSNSMPHFMCRAKKMNQPCIFKWMMQGQVFRMSVLEFMEVINIPRHTGQQDRIHSLADMKDGEFATLLDPEVTKDFMPENIRPKHLVFIYKTWFYILSKTLLPLSNAHEESNLHPAVRHAIFKLSHGMVFDFDDCFLRTMVSTAELPFQYKPYAPWLQAICNFGRSEEFIAHHHPKLFTPPTRDTLHMLRQPNNPFSTYVGVRQFINERNMLKNFQKSCYHFKVSLRSQQMLENFIDAN